MAYAFKQIEAHDPNNPGLVAPNASVTIFEPGDPTKTPLTLTTLTGDPLPNPVTVNGLGYGPAFMHATLPQVAWAGGGLTGTFESYEGMRDEAIAARTAAEEAAATAGADAAAVADAAIGTATDEATAAAAAAEAAAASADASAGSAVNTATVNESGRLIITKANAETIDAGSVIGAKGDKGDQGLPGVNAVANDTATAGYINASSSATKTALTAKVIEGVRREDMLLNGAVADGVADDSAVFFAARTKAGTEGTVHFAARPGAAVTTYKIDTNMKDTHISADPSVVIINAKTIGYAPKFRTPINIQTTSLGKTITYPATVGLQASVAAAAAVTPQTMKVAAEDLTTWERFAANVSGELLVDAGAGTSTVVANRVTWASNFTETAQGIRKVPAVGDMYEATWVNTASGSAVLGLLDTNGRWVFLWPATSGAITVERTTPDGPAKTTNLAMPNGSAYKYYPMIRMSVRFISMNEVVLYINGLQTHRFTLATPVAKVLLGTVASGSSTTAITDVVKFTNYVPASPRTTTVSVIGDSLAHVPAAGVSWQKLLPISFSVLPGGGMLKVRQNLAISGTSAANWADPAHAQYIGNQSFVGDDFVLVQLGTNDVQSNRTAAQYKANLTTIAAKIIADGAKPIFGVFPVWTAPSQTGIGPATTNYWLSAELRGALIRWAAENGHELAMVNDAFGANLDWYADNIHPTDEGQPVFARAFAQAIARKRLA